MKTAITTNEIQFPIDPHSDVQLLRGPDNMSIVLVSCDGQRRAYIDNCGDEALPLGEDGSPPPLNSKGELICVHHAARFDACQGCLISPGNARHVERLANGLVTIPVVSTNEASNLITLDITAKHGETWNRIQSLRFRKSFGRGPMGSARHLLARFIGRGPNGKN